MTIELNHPTTHSALILDAVCPEVGHAELVANDNCRAVKQHLADTHQSAGRVVQRQCVVHHLIIPQSHHVEQSSRHHEEPKTINHSCICRKNELVNFQLPE